MYRKTFAEIHLETLKENARTVTQAYSCYRYFIGVVKANAYGHGPYIAQSLIDGGVNYLAVSSLEEALELRSFIADIPILILEPCALDHLDVILENSLTITLDSLEDAKALSALPLTRKLNVHLKLDCGMNRLGIKTAAETEEILSDLRKNPLVNVEGIFTHIGTAGISDPYYDRSIRNFLELTKNIDLSEIPIVHINRSMTLVHHKPFEWETGVRLGILLYGFNLSVPEPRGLRKIKRKILLKKTGISPAILENHLNVKPAFSLKSEVISLRSVKKGEYVGYGAGYVAKEDHLAATVCAGLYDGVKPGMKYVSIGKRRYPIIGQVCMDMTVVRVDDRVKLHDTVEFFGEDLSVKEVCASCRLNAYQLFTQVSTRVPRLYSDGTEIKY